MLYDFNSHYHVMISTCRNASAISTWRCEQLRMTEQKLTVKKKLSALSRIPGAGSGVSQGKFILVHTQPSFPRLGASVSDLLSTRLYTYHCKLVLDWPINFQFGRLCLPNIQLPPIKHPVTCDNLLRQSAL